MVQLYRVDNSSYATWPSAGPSVPDGRHHFDSMSYWGVFRSGGTRFDFKLDFTHHDGVTLGEEGDIDLYRRSDGSSTSLTLADDTPDGNDVVEDGDQTATQQQYILTDLQGDNPLPVELASFTAQAAEDLVASAREMSRVVSRVTELALKTRQVAAQIDAEAVVTGQPGEAFTSVVAAEVKGLARQTSQATLEIENTVSEILATSRRYEEAIGQIIKNISAINKVSEHLGELMLSPAPHAVPGMPPAPLTPAGDADQAPPAPEEPMAAPTASDEPEPSVPEPPVDVPDPFTREPEPDPEGDPEGDPDAKPAFSLDDDGEAPVPSLEEVAQETQDVIQELGLDIPGPAQEEAPTPQETETVASEPVTDKPSTPGDDPAAEEPADVAPADGEPAAETPSESTAPKPVGSNGNVFLLNKPRNPRPLKSDPEPEAPAGTTEDLPASDGPGPEPEPETVPADKPSPTVMRLNKTKD